MFKKLLLVFTAITLVLHPVSVFASQRVDVSAECAVTVDSLTGQVFFEKRANQKHAMASTTKIMTCLLACESGRLNENVTVTADMLQGCEGTLLYLKPGDELTLLDLVKGAMLASGNDAANCIAYFIAGNLQHFAEMMNRRAVMLEMKNTHFVTPSGLDDEGHFSTAYDMALLAKAAAKNSVLLSIASCPSDEITVSGVKRTVYNHNKLLNENSRFKGMKTGFTEKAGRCLVTIYDNGASSIITVTLNAPDDWEDHKALVKNARKHYKTVNENEIIRVNAVGADKETLRCSYHYQLSACGTVTKQLYYYPFVYAPVSKGTAVGTVKLFIENNIVATVEIIADEELYNGRQEQYQTSKIYG